MGYKEEYKKWMESPALDSSLRAELEAIKDEKEIESRFFAPLGFGTAGLRGKMGVGISRMNVHIVKQATQGLANMMIKVHGSACERGVIIGYDCRNLSDVFSREAACVLAANGITVHMFPDMRPTPELSFAILKLNAAAGINVTASHNQAIYNGYKVYWEDGAQLSGAHAKAIAREIEKIDIFEGAKTGDYFQFIKDGLIKMISTDVDEEFLQNAMSVVIRPEEIARAADLGVVYTPFHGAGYKMVPEAFSRLGLKNLRCEPSQMIPDGNFPTVKSPNPEYPEAFALALELARKTGASLIIGTDPDADRVGIIGRDRDGKYRAFTGNETGILLFDYIIRARKAVGTLPAGAFTVKSIVSSHMIDRIGKMHGIPVYSTFTGFKNIAERVNIEQQKGGECIFSFEESYGYMLGDFVRDKDSIGTSCIILEMTAHYFNRGMTLIDALDACYEEYGFFTDRSISVVMEGIDGLMRMRALMRSLRENPPAYIAGYAVTEVRDYLGGSLRSGGNVSKMELSGSDVLSFTMEDGTVFTIRPSGTEPKIKTYILSSGKDAAETGGRADSYGEFARGFLK